jgi:hypothetical protein
MAPNRWLSVLPAVLAAGVAFAQQTTPTTGYRSGDVPTTGTDATNTNVGAPITPATPTGTTGDAGVAPGPASSPMGGYGPLVTDTGVPPSRVASAPARTRAPGITTIVPHARASGAARQRQRAASSISWSASAPDKAEKR